MSIAKSDDGELAGYDGVSIFHAYPARIAYVVLSLALFATLLKGSVGGDVLGIDFGVFYVGGSLIASDGYNAAYDSVTFSDALAGRHFSALDGASHVTHFISTPPFGWFAQALSWLPFSVSMAAWFVAGVVAFPISVRRLGLPVWVSAALAISPAMAFNTILGQTGAFVLLLFVFLHHAVASEQRVRAGVLAGLCILKPPLAFGYGLLWLLQFRRYRESILIAAITGLVVSFPTLMGGISPWRGFVETMIDRAEYEGAWSQPSLSIPEFLKLLVQHASFETTVACWVLGLVGGGYFVLLAHRRYGHDAEVMSAVAVIAGVMASPHLLIYDSFVLLIPVAVAYRRGLLTGERGALLAVIHTSSIALGPVLYHLQFDLIGRGISLELPALVFSCLLLARWGDEAPTSPIEELTPALAKV